ncbi:MAG: type II secretion system protein N [Gammaproteobacteria bacterium]|nr:type II secretion system protein N [Gammaproteobacteria bacterium]
MTVVVYSFFLLATLPAKMLAERFLPQDITVQNWYGSVWNGSASDVDIQGYPLKNVAWNFNIFPLLLGKVSYDITLPYGVLTIHVRGQTLEIKNAKLDVAIDQLIEDYHLPVTDLFGLLKINLSYLAINDLVLSDAEGVIEIKDAGYAGISESAMGTYKVNVSTHNNEIIARLSGSGKVKINGEMTLYPNQKFQIKGVIKTDKSIENNMASTLLLFSKKNNQGDYVFKTSGNIPAFQ